MDKEYAQILAKIRLDREMNFFRKHKNYWKKENEE